MRERVLKRYFRTRKRDFISLAAINFTLPPDEEEPPSGPLALTADSTAVLADSTAEVVNVPGGVRPEFAAINAAFVARDARIAAIRVERGI